MATAKTEAAKRYAAKMARFVYLKLNRGTDKDILDRLESVPSMQGYIKRLIRQDISQERKGETKMKKIINGRKYDTETATLIAKWDNGIYGDFTSVSEELYEKRNGEWFLYGSGGAKTKYAVATGSNSWGGGEGITPLTEDEAKEWAEKHLSVEQYEEIWGPVEE